MALIKNSKLKIKNYLPIRTLFKEAALTLIVPHKTFKRIPKNPNLNYKILIPLMSFSGLIFAAVHLMAAHRTIFFVQGRSDYAIPLASPFFSPAVWVLGSLSFFYIAKLFKKNIPLKRVEVGAFYLWFAWVIMPAVDLLNPILGTPFRLGMLWGAQVHLEWFYIFPVLVVQSYFLIRNLLKLSDKKGFVTILIALSVPFVGRYVIQPIFIYTYKILSVPGLFQSDFLILVGPTVSVFGFCLWLAHKKKPSLAFVAKTALACLLVFSMSVTTVLLAPFPHFSSVSKNTNNIPAGGKSHFTNSYTWDSSELASGTVNDTGTSGTQWWNEEKTGITFSGFTGSLRTIVDIYINVNITAITDANTNETTYPKIQGCYSSDSGSNYYCSDWLSLTASDTGSHTFTITSSSINTYVSNGDGAAATSAEWDSMVSNMGTGATNQVIIHAVTGTDGQGTPAAWDAISFNSYTLHVDYRTRVTGSTWQWYQNKDAIQPDTSLASTNTAITNIHRNDILRIRMLLASSSEGDLEPAGEQAFKLQFAVLAGADCAGGDETWRDVAAAGAKTATWRGYDNATPADGATVTSSLLSAANLESYEEQNNSATNPAAITNGTAGEWDWVVQNYLAYGNTSYCFQMVATTGVNNTTYSATYTPEVTTAGGIVNLKGKINIKGKINLR